MSSSLKNTYKRLSIKVYIRLFQYRFLTSGKGLGLMAKNITAHLLNENAHSHFIRSLTFIYPIIYLAVTC